MTLKQRLENNWLIVVIIASAAVAAATWAVSEAVRVEPRDFANEQLRDSVAALQAALDRRSGSPGAIDTVFVTRTDTVRSEATGADRVPDACAPLPTLRNQGVLVDLSHGQRAWSSTDRSVLDPVFLASLVTRDNITVTGISDSSCVTVDDLRPWRGMVLAIPKGKLIQPWFRDAVVEWVRKDSARVVLLGYELGDRHHEGNLDFVARAFGLSFNTDLLAPDTSWSWPSKPYGTPIRFERSELPADPLFDGVGELVLTNVSTLITEPGARVLLAAGASRPVAWPVSGPRYRDFRWHDGFPEGQRYGPREAAWAPVIAVASSELSGAGEALAIGTWKIPVQEHAHSTRFVRNLILWLVDGLR